MFEPLGKELCVRLELGKPIRCSDGPFGELADVIVDPTTKRVTHVVAQPHKLDGVSRLVPIELADSTEDGEDGLTLSCTVEAATQLSSVQEQAYLRLGDTPVSDPDWDVGVENVLAMPYYGGEFGPYAGDLDSYGVAYDRVPKGEVEIRRASSVSAADGDYIGQVDGFVVDADGHVTHFVLEKGHLWGKREVTIPIGAVAKVETDAVTLRISKKEVEDLPSVRVHRWF
jgi:sporulation protein YlmC with PRC-barrel domain